MFRKFSRDSVTLPAKDAIHVYIGIVIFPLLVAKICIARFFKKFYKSLSLYGMLSLISVYLVTSISAGYYVSYTINSQYVVLAENGKSVKVSVNLGRKVIQQKCSACHSLERVFAYAKTKDDWQNYILRMRAKDPAILTDREATQVLGYLIKNLGINETTLDIQLGIKIILEKCHKCHTIERIFTARKTAEEWTQTIELMRSFDPYLLNDREARQINNYAAKILSRQKSE
jgi:cytochrome c2